jgi:16S rRNA (adenine1518-N6/adenine1519-N6)-dimethyltransferase
MTTPLIQTVDEKDQVIGSATIKEIWSRGLRFRVSRIMVEEPGGRVLLQKRLSTKDLYPGRWDNSAAGHVDAGETYLVAARRELAEEIGLSGVRLKEIEHYYEEARFKDMLLNEWNRLYRVSVAGTSLDLALQADEVEEVRWFTRDELRDLLANRPDQLTHGLRHAIARHYS